MRIKMSLKKKAVAQILILATILAAVAIFVSYTTYSETMDDHYKATARSIADTAAIVIGEEPVSSYVDEVMELYLKTPKEEFKNRHEEESYYAKYDHIADETYRRIADELDRIRRAHNVLSLYIIGVDEKSRSCVYVMDASSPEMVCRIGTWDIIYEKNYNIFSEPEKGFESYITNTEEYGWLCSAGSAIKAKDGRIIAYAMVDLSMDKVMEDRYVFLAELCLILVFLTLVLIFISTQILSVSVVNPIKYLAGMARTFVENMNRNMEDRDGFLFKKWKIRSGDEIEELFHSIQFMEKEIYTYIDNLSKITSEKERIGAELNVATQIQANMLPSIFPAFPGREEFDIFATMNPAKEVGGDFYDFFMIDERHIAVVIADVSGKGVPAALFMVIGKTLIKDHTQPGRDLGEVFTKVNELLCESNSENLFITAFEGVLDLMTGEFTFVNAGHDAPYLCKKNGEFLPFKVKPGFVLAGMEGMKYHSDRIFLDEGDKLFLYTDGVTDAMNPEHKLYGSKRLEDTLEKYKKEKPEKILPGIKKEIDSFVGEAAQFDDITMLCLEYRQKMKE